jgi:hypothetical protein
LGGRLAALFGPVWGFEEGLEGVQGAGEPLALVARPNEADSE